MRAEAACTRTFEAARAPIVMARSLRAAQPHAVGGGVALLDLDDRARLQVAPLDEAQELRILIGDAADRDPLPQRTAQKRIERPPLDDAFRVRDRIAVRIDRRAAEHLVDPVDQPIGDRVLQVFRFVVDLGPAHAHHLHQKQLDQPVPPDHQRGEPLARRREPDARVGLVLDQPRLGQRLHHRRRGARARRRARAASWPIGTRSALARQAQLRLENGLQVVLDGEGGQGHLTSYSTILVF